MSAYFVTYGDNRLVLAGYPGALAFDHGSAPIRDLYVATFGEVTSYISAVDNGATSTWTIGPETAEFIYVPENSTLILRNETPLYYRAMINHQQLTDYLDGTDPDDGRTTTASGIFGSDANFIEIYSDINKFTATGTYQGVNGSNSGQWRPHTISYLRMGLDNDYGYGTFSFGSSVSASYQAQGAYNNWSYQTLGASTHLNTGVNFSAFSSYQSAYFSVPKVNQQGTYTATAGVRFGNTDYASTTVYKKPNGGSVFRTQNFTSGSISFTTAIGGTLSIYGKTNIAGMVGGNVNLNGKWSATGIAP